MVTIQGRLRAADRRFIDSLFEMEGGYVLDFSNRTFKEFFQDELGVDIDQHRFAVEGTSKAKRLRCFLKISEHQIAVRALLALWEYRETLRITSGTEEKIENAETRFFQIIERLGGQRPVKDIPTSSQPTEFVPDDTAAGELSSMLISLSDLPPQERGYEFERFLKRLFDANSLEGRGSFRIRGEQMDGSFQLGGETYLLEAKWTSAKTDAATLRAFNAKIEEKAAWTRGLFVSYSGFSDDGLFAFGRGKRVVCMDGLDLHDMLESRLGLADVLSRKVRRASETGNPFVRVHDLYAGNAS